MLFDCLLVVVCFPPSASTSRGAASVSSGWSGGSRSRGWWSARGHPVELQLSPVGRPVAAVAGVLGARDDGAARRLEGLRARRAAATAPRRLQPEGGRDRRRDAGGAAADRPDAGAAGSRFQPGVRVRRERSARRSRARRRAHRAAVRIAGVAGAQPRDQRAVAHAADHGGAPDSPDRDGVPPRLREHPLHPGRAHAVVLQPGSGRGARRAGDQPRGVADHRRADPAEVRVRPGVRAGGAHGPRAGDAADRVPDQADVARRCSSARSARASTGTSSRSTSSAR